jgi:hypothetical protein
MLYVLFREAIASATLLCGFLFTAFGFALWPAEHDLLSALNEDTWECAHGVRDAIAAVHGVSPKRVSHKLVDYRLLRLAKRGLVIAFFNWDEECPHIPPCGEWLYALTPEGRKKLDAASETQVALVPAEA